MGRQTCSSKPQRFWGPSCHHRVNMLQHSPVVDAYPDKPDLLLTVMVPAFVLVATMATLPQCGTPKGAVEG